MLKQTRFFISAALVVVLSVSAFILSNPNRVEACGIPQPATLLQLFMGSDLIVVADVKSEKDGEKVIDEKDYYSVEVSRNLRVYEVLKGKTARNLVFFKTEYRDKNEDNEAADEDAGEGYYPYGYRGVSKIASGERYLFFFKKNDETGRLELSDEYSGVKKLSDFELNIHRKRLAELKKIVETKENQLDAITDWIVRLIEEPATRWDGIADLTESFQAVEYKGDEEIAEPFVIDEDFNAGTPAIAENLSDSQKNYISSIYFSSMQNIFNQSDADEFNYSLSSLVSRWDKSRILTFAYSVLQTAEQTNPEKAGRVMDYISTIVNDEELSEISSRYNEIESEKAAEETDEQENADDEKAEAENEIKAAAETIENPETIVAIKSNGSLQTESAEEPATTEKLTSAQKRENALRDFKNRYEHLLARNFAVEKEPEEVVQK